MGDIKYKSIGFQKNIMWRQNALRPLGWRMGGDPCFKFKHVLNMFMTLFDLFDLGLTQN